MPLVYGEGAEKAFERLKEELFKRSRKHQLDELSSVSHTFNFAKRLKTPRSQSSSVHSGRNLNFLDPGPLFYSKYSVHRNSNRIDATIKQSLIDQLYFTKIDDRLISLKAAQGTTCRWFLTKPEYISWHDVTQQPNHGGFLWIKGSTGTGKSTLMKLLFEKAKFNAKGDFSQITLSFFFLAQGTVEEKSATGLYRSLIHQLFEKAMDLRDSLEWMTADGARVVQRNGWHGEALKQTLTHAVQKLWSRSLTIFVDALDVCDTTQVAGIIYFFEELCDCARKAQVRLQICFSSRHYPTIVIQKGIEIALEDEIGHTKDIEQYIKSKFRLGKSKLNHAESLRSEILEKSSSIFLWVVLVLDILNSEYPDSSISIKKIRERLKEIERYELPILAALATGSYKAVPTFLEIQAKIRSQEPLLHHLCKQCSENRNKCTNFGCNFNFSRHRNISSYVAEQGDEAIPTFLCALGKLDVESKNMFNRTPLLWAAEKGHEAVAKLLLEKGAELEAKDKNSQTPLLWAVKKGHYPVVKLLLEKGANLEAKDKDGQTPLLWAAEKGHKAVVKLLLEKGAKPH